MGKPQFENQTMISAVSNKKIRRITGSTSSPVNDSSYQRVTIFASPKTYSRLFNARLIWNSGGGEEIGTVANSYKEYIVDMQIDQSSGIGMFKFKSSMANSTIKFDQGYFKENEVAVSNNLFFPGDLGAVSSQLNNVYFDESLGMQLVFWHNFGKTVSSLREWVLFFEEEVIAR